VIATTFTQSDESIAKKSCASPVRGERARMRRTEKTRQSWIGSLRAVHARSARIAASLRSGAPQHVEHLARHEPRERNSPRRP
jgi:hypothetical protein